MFLEHPWRLRYNSGVRFEVATATRIVFGPGTWPETVEAATALGTRALVVTGGSSERAKGLLTRLAETGISHVLFRVEGEPDLDTVERGVAAARQGKSDLVISFGGGSAIDCGKAIAALLTNSGGLLAYLEVVGSGRPLEQPPAPFIAIPTTAGTGSEVTRNAVIASPEHRVKVSLRSPRMLAHLAVIDPELTLGLPPAITAATGLDALTQLIEPYVSIRANPLTDGFCLEGLARVARSLRRTFHHGTDLAARTDMSLASLLGGLSLANAGLGVVHGFAGPIGGEFPAPHGAVCAALLPHGIAANIRALRARDPDGEALRRYEDVARILTDSASVAAEDAVAWTAELVSELAIPQLRSYGLKISNIDALISKGVASSSMKGNPIALQPDELRDVLAAAI
jgi:alcohol dehydrogenase class IV